MSTLAKQAKPGLEFGKREALELLGAEYFYFFVLLLGGHTQRCSGLLLGLCSAVTRGEALRSICGPDTPALGFLPGFLWQGLPAVPKT